jgi:hypothetical protein
MFDLEQSIAAWRQEMLSGGLQTDALLDELESHLREETARQIRSGIAASEAFESAVRQIGSADALQAEFQKVTWPTPAQLRRWGTAAYGVELAAYTALQIRLLSNAGPSHHDLILGMIGLAVTLGAAYGIWRLAPHVMRHVASKSVREAIFVAGCISGVVWLLLFARFILPGLVLTPGQFAVVFLWSMLPLVAFPAVATGLDQREGERVR